MPIAENRFNNDISLSQFVREAFMDGQPHHAEEVHRAYVTAVEALPPPSRGGKRRSCSYSSFRSLMYILRRLNLIEYVLDESGEVATVPAHQRGTKNLYASQMSENPDLAPARLLRIVPGAESNLSWRDPWGFFQGRAR